MSGIFNLFLKRTFHSLRMVMFCLWGLFIVSSCADLFAADWTGWRGDGTGKVSDASAPVYWNQNSGVAWKTDLPGRGVSTPIIIGNKVFVTTAVDADFQHPLRSYIRPAFACMLIVLLYNLIIHFSHKFQEHPRYYWWNSLSAGFMVIIFISLSVLLELLTASDSMLHSKALSLSSLPRLWLATSIVASSGILASFLLVRQAPVMKHYLSLIIIMLIISYFVFVPDDKIVFPRNAGQYAGWILAGSGLICGMLSIHRYGLLWTLTGITTIIGFLIYMAVIQQINDNPEDLYRNHQYRFWILTGFAGAFCLYTAGRSLVYSNLTNFHEQQGWINSVSACMILGVATSQFYLINFLLPSQGLTRSIVCLDLESGKRLWTQGYFTSERERVHNKNSHATPTPVSDGKAIYAYFGNAGMMCVELDGKIRWINQKLPYHDYYGAASSPVIHQDQVFLSCIDLEAPYVTALNCQNGEQVWKQPFQIDKLVGSYATPWIGSLNNQVQLIINGGRSLISYEPATGKILWNIKHIVGEVIPTPVVEQNWIIGGGDGMLFAYLLPESTTSDSQPIPELKWETNKTAPFHCSSLIHQNQLITLTDQGVLASRDLTSGKKIFWQKRLSGNFTASPLLIGQHLYVTSREGITSVFKLSETNIELVSENNLDDAIESSLAYAQGKIIIRTPSKIWCIHGHTPLDLNATTTSLDSKPAN